MQNKLLRKSITHSNWKAKLFTKKLSVKTQEHILAPSMDASIMHLLMGYVMHIIYEKSVGRICTNLCVTDEGIANAGSAKNQLTERADGLSARAITTSAVARLCVLSALMPLAGLAADAVRFIRIMFMTSTTLVTRKKTLRLATLLNQQAQMISRQKYQNAFSYAQIVIG